MEKDLPNVDYLIENNTLYRKQLIISKTMTKKTKISSFLTIFDYIRYIFDYNQTTFHINGPDSNRCDDFD